MTFSLLSRAAALGLLSTAQFAAVGALDPGALTDSGLVVGETHRVAGSVYSVDKFLGIPFAVSPPERFGAPKPAKKSVLPILAKQKKPSCIQQFNCKFSACGGRV
jgi:carboxylesterase type B